MDSSSDLIQVETTTDKEGEAQRIATALVERRLAACVQIVGPIRSTYRWQGEIETSSEWRVTAKTSRKLFRAVEEEILRHHSYDTPELIALQVVAGGERYLAWWRKQLGEESAESS